MVSSESRYGSTGFGVSGFDLDFFIEVDGGVWGFDVVDCGTGVDGVSVGASALSVVEVDASVGVESVIRGILLFLGCCCVSTGEVVSSVF